MARLALFLIPGQLFREASASISAMGLTEKETVQSRGLSAHIGLPVIATEVTEFISFSS